MTWIDGQASSTIGVIPKVLANLEETRAPPGKQKHTHHEARWTDIDGFRRQLRFTREPSKREYSVIEIKTDYE